MVVNNNIFQENGLVHTEATTPKRKKEEANDEKNKKVKNTESNTSIPSTPTSAAKKAGPKTPREKFELPEGFTVEEKKTEKKSWKEYRGPDGMKQQIFEIIISIYYICRKEISLYRRDTEKPLWKHEGLQCQFQT